MLATSSSPRVPRHNLWLVNGLGFRVQGAGFRAKDLERWAVCNIGASSTVLICFLGSLRVSLEGFYKGFYNEEP